MRTLILLFRLSQWLVLCDYELVNEIVVHLIQVPEQISFRLALKVEDLFESLDSSPIWLRSTSSVIVKVLFHCSSNRRGRVRELRHSLFFVVVELAETDDFGHLVFFDLLVDYGTQMVDVASNFLRSYQ